MLPPKSFRLTDLLRSIALGILLGWLLVSISDPSRKRFDLMLTDNHPSLEVFVG